MAKIESRRFDVEKGEIVLFVSKPELNSLPLVALFDGKIEFSGKAQICFQKPVIRLLEPEFFNGNLVYRVIDYVSGARHGYIIGRGKGNISEFVVGKEAVLERVLADEKLKAHADWIRKLEKPYRLPEIKEISYVDA